MTIYRNGVEVTIPDTEEAIAQVCASLTAESPRPRPVDLTDDEIALGLRIKNAIVHALRGRR